jgi:drug/metabolite transporter (DMT)-like permease
VALLAILASVTVGTAAQLCMKEGAVQAGAHPNLFSHVGLPGFGSLWVTLAAALNLLGLVAWVRAIREIPLGIAFAFSQIMHVMVPLSSWLILGERISIIRWVGIGLIVAGLMAVAQPYARLEQGKKGRMANDE